MQNPSSAAIGSWFRGEIEEDGMFEDHIYLWRHMLETIPEKDLSQLRVLDYGCSRGGFLQTLFERRPFQRGIGVDIAERSLAIARQRHARLPVEFISPAALADHAAGIDIAFSHEVLYLLPDLYGHASLMAQTLAGAGVYYAAIGCHIANPLWPRWRKLIAATTNLPVFDYSLDDFAAAFRRAGFRVEMRPFSLHDFILIKPDNPYFPTAADSLDYHARIKTIIRASKAE